MMMRRPMTRLHSVEDGDKGSVRLRQTTRESVEMAILQWQVRNHGSTNERARCSYGQNTSSKKL
jgi:hypothetical protein